MKNGDNKRDRFAQNLYTKIESTESVGEKCLRNDWNLFPPLHLKEVVF